MIALLLCLAGCMANNTLTTSGMSSDNVSNLPRLCVGMNQKQVLRIMRHPYSQETYTVDCDIYDVWFYVTRTTALDQSRMVPLNLTPLTFKNGFLIGWGYEYYRHIFKLQEPPPKPPTPAPAKEDAPIEKTPTLQKEAAPVSMSTPPKKEKDSEEDSIPLDEDDDKMLEESDEQNFDFW